MECLPTGRRCADGLMPSSQGCLGTMQPSRVEEGDSHGGHAHKGPSFLLLSICFLARNCSNTCHTPLCHSSLCFQSNEFSWPWTGTHHEHVLRSIFSRLLNFLGICHSDRKLAKHETFLPTTTTLRNRLNSLLRIEVKLVGCIQGVTLSCSCPHLSPYFSV